MKTKILLVDDHQIVIDGMRSILSEEPSVEVIGWANDGKEGLDCCRMLAPDLVLMDLDMPLMSGMVAARELKATMPHIKVIILSLHAEKSVIQHMIQTGVDGYLMKNSDKEEVLRAIKAVAAGQKYFSSAVTLSLSSMMETKVPPPTSELQQQLSLLSDREVEVLKAIAEGATNKEIGQQLHLSPRTVDAHRANIMKKLEIKKVTGLVRFALKTGLVD